MKTCGLSSLSQRQIPRMKFPDFNICLARQDTISPFPIFGRDCDSLVVEERCPIPLLLCSLDRARASEVPNVQNLAAVSPPSTGCVPALKMSSLLQFVSC